ncbi:MAG: NAD(+) synthase [Phycisphaerales bacterium]
MKLIRVAAAVLNQTPMDWDRNAANIRGAIAEAQRRNVDILCLPELCVSGYGCEDAFFSPALRRMAWRVLREILPDTRGMIVSLGVPVMHRNALFNCAAVAVDGRLVALVAKRHLAGDGLHYEPRWFKAWPEGARAMVDHELGEPVGAAPRAGASDDAPDGPARGAPGIPIGDLHIEAGDVRIGFEICEDAWVAARPGAGLAARGVDVILNPSASHFALGKHAVRERLVLEGSRAFGLTYVYSNLLGNEAGRAIYDGDAMIATGGRLVARGRRFSFRPFEVVDAVVDVEATRTTQSRTSSYVPSVDQDPLCVVVTHRYRVNGPGAGLPAREAWERSPSLEFEEFARAVALGLFDYARKSRSAGFVVSLSGGADSSACACLVALMTRLAVDDLGIAGFRGAFAHVPALGAIGATDGTDARDTAGAPRGAPTNDETRALTRALLTTIYQSTRNSSGTTRDAARVVAEAIGARHHEFDVGEIVDRYCALAEQAEGRALDWQRDDLALQNIQARVRSPSAWFVANLRGALLLTTSNRSEAAVGYATMDGDTSGGLAPIGGIDKAFLRRWLRWLECDGPVGLSSGGGAIPALRSVNVQAPTAELRPPGSHQTDEGDLMPYEVLEAIEDAAIGQGRSPAEALRTLRGEFPPRPQRTGQGAAPQRAPHGGPSTTDVPAYAVEDLRTWVRRFYTLWARNQWKRERLAPSFHVDDKNLDPRSWCRFPILSGGFVRELAEMDGAESGPRPLRANGAERETGPADDDDATRW